MPDIPFVFEDVQATSRTTLLKLAGVPWNITPMGWGQFLGYLAIGVVVGLLALPASMPFGAKIGAGLGAGAAIMLTFVLIHELGHAISARMVGSPMDEVLITATRTITLYDDDTDPPSRVHLGRSLGGPVMSLTVGLAALGVWQLTSLATTPAGNLVLGAFCIANLAYGVMSWLPGPGMDGEIIWRELGSSRERT